MHDSIVTDTNRYYNEDADLERIAESIEKEVSKMSIRDVVWEIKEINSNAKLWNEVWNLVEATWRKRGVDSTIDDLLSELWASDTDYKNEVLFIYHLGLETKIRELLIERMVDVATTEYYESRD